MGELNLEWWQMIIAALLYLGYLAWVMFGGIKPKKVKPAVYTIMTALMIYGVITQFSAIHTLAEILNISFILLIGFIKGIYLGRKKIVEKNDGTWYVHHNGKYIIAWVIFFAIKLVITQILKMVLSADIPFWHTILYFSFYYPWRTINIFIANPDMRREVLSRKK